MLRWLWAASPRLPLGIRSSAPAGDKSLAVARIEELVGRDVGNEQVQEWYAEGDDILEALAEAVHGDIDPRTLDEPVVRAWQADGREIERVFMVNMAKLGRAVGESGLTDEKAARDIARGDLDPFSDRS